MSTLALTELLGLPVFEPLAAANAAVCANWLLRHRKIGRASRS